MLSSIQGYQSAIIARNNETSNNPTYIVTLPDGTEKKVWLTSMEVGMLKKELDKHVSSTNDADLDKRISPLFIERVVDACRNPRYCPMISAVLRDFLNKTVQQLFTKIGLRQEI